VTDPLTIVKFVQFASSLLAGGAALFAALVCAPASETTEAASVVDFARRIALAGVIVAIVSAGLWLILIAADIEQVSTAEVIAGGAVWSVARETQFGQLLLIRFGLALILIATLLLVPERQYCRWNSVRLGEAAIAVLFVAMLAGSGHAGAQSGVPGKFHSGVDALHLVAAAAWTGGMVPLLVSMGPHVTLTPAARLVLVRRFSVLATLSVAALAVSGAVNTWFMVGTLSDLIGTSYGRILLVKIVLFAAMLIFAALNRLVLTPRLIEAQGPRSSPLRLLRLSVIMEIVCALAVIGAVTVLGGLEPPAHLRSLEADSVHAPAAGEGIETPVRRS
jgi:copper resistance protein D